MKRTSDVFFLSLFLPLDLGRTLGKGIGDGGGRLEMGLGDGEDEV